MNFPQKQMTPCCMNDPVGVTVFMGRADREMRIPDILQIQIVSFLTLYAIQLTAIHCHFYSLVLQKKIYSAQDSIGKYTTCISILIWHFSCGLVILSNDMKYKIITPSNYRACNAECTFMLSCNTHQCLNTDLKGYQNAYKESITMK